MDAPTRDFVLSRMERKPAPSVRAAEEAGAVSMTSPAPASNTNTRGPRRDPRSLAMGAHALAADERVTVALRFTSAGSTASMREVGGLIDAFPEAEVTARAP